MKDFNSKWQAAAAQARRAAPRKEEAPLGFATRVVARSLNSPGLSPERTWDLLLPRLLAGSLVVLGLCAAFELPHFRNTRPLEPGIENAVAQLVWSL